MRHGENVHAKTGHRQFEINLQFKKKKKGEKNNKYILFFDCIFRKSVFSWPMIWDNPCFHSVQVNLHAYVRAPCIYWEGSPSSISLVTDSP